MTFAQDLLNPVARRTVYCHSLPLQGCERCDAGLGECSPRMSTRRGERSAGVAARRRGTSSHWHGREGEEEEEQEKEEQQQEEQGAGRGGRGASQVKEEQQQGEGEERRQ